MPSPKLFFVQEDEQWLSSSYKTGRGLRLSHLDLLPRFMCYVDEIRTRDKVELMLGVTFFWQIADTAALLESTDEGRCIAGKDTGAQAELHKISQETTEHLNRPQKQEQDSWADALSIQAFFEHLPKALSRSEQLDIYRRLRKQALMDALSQSQARLYFTPSDVNLSIETVG